MRKKILHYVGWLFMIFYFGILVWSFVYAEIKPAPRYFLLDKGWDRFWANLSFWSVQSNIIVFGFLLYYGISRYNTKIKVKNELFVIMLSYITITMLLFWCALSSKFTENDPEKNPLVLYANSYDTFEDWFLTCALHLFSAIGLYVTFYIHLKNNKKIIYIRKWHEWYAPISFLILIIYLAWVMIRGEIMLNLDYDTLVYKGVVYTKGILSFPYFFFDWTVHNGWEQLATGILLISILIIGIQYLLIYINNKYCNENINKSDDLESKSLSNKNKFLKILVVLDAIFFGLVISFAIYKLTLTKNYIVNSQENYSITTFCYLICYIFEIIIPIASITLKILLWKNRNTKLEIWNVILNLCCLFYINYYFVIPILISIITEQIIIYKSSIVKSKNLLL